MIQLQGPGLVLGTVQLGLPYGAANRTGLPAEADAIALLKAAAASGIRIIDTARAYGEAEQRIGLALPPSSQIAVVTKLAPLENISDDVAPEIAIAAARESLAASRAALGRNHIDALLLHRPGHRTAWQGAVWEWLQSERETGRIGRLGVSVQNPQEALSAIADPDVAQVQLPFNLLDRRWVASGVIDAFRRRPHVIVHVRSVFLQGLLAAGSGARWPEIAGLDPAYLMQNLTQLAAELGRDSVADVALAFVRAQDWIDGVVIGMETPEQLAINSRLFLQNPLTAGELEQIATKTPAVPAAFLDPPDWRKTAINPSDR
jgi:aryl-alcohol dehydrogenase-like predicted oxidoreductase